MTCDPQVMCGVAPCGCVTAINTLVHEPEQVEQFHRDMESSGRSVIYMAKSDAVAALALNCNHRR